MAIQLLLCVCELQLGEENPNSRRADSSIMWLQHQCRWPILLYWLHFVFEKGSSGDVPFANSYGRPIETPPGHKDNMLQFGDDCKEERIQVSGVTHSSCQGEMRTLTSIAAECWQHLEGLLQAVSFVFLSVSVQQHELDTIHPLVWLAASLQVNHIEYLAQ